MPPTPVLSESVLRAALTGLEARRDQIEGTISELKAALGQGGGSQQPTPRPTKEANSTAPARRKFSAATRRKMAAAQKKRWAAARKASPA